MANRIAGLIGPGVGPWIHTHVLAGLRVRITGLTRGVVKVVTLDTVHVFEEPGTYELSDSPMCKVEYHGEDRTMVCTFLSGATNAVR